MDMGMNDVNSAFFGYIISKAESDKEDLLELINDQAATIRKLKLSNVKTRFFVGVAAIGCIALFTKVIAYEQERRTDMSCEISELRRRVNDLEDTKGV